jgi:energy-coupling factor transporter ATP-binding protein EcfA2
VVGPNGGGKSTLIRLLNGLLVADSGRVRVAGLDPAAQPFEVRRRVSVLFQNPDNGLVAPFVEDDVAFGLENLGVERAEMRGRVREAIASVGLAGYERREPHTLSGGEKQRVALAGLLAVGPEVLLLDEPTAMLDAAGREEVLGRVRDLARSRTVLHVTHHLEELFDADRVLVLGGGLLAADTTPRSSSPTRTSAGEPARLADGAEACGRARAAVLPDAGGAGRRRRAEEQGRFRGGGAVRIELEGVRHVYSPGTPFAVEALKGVSMSVEPGEVLGVIGGTGSGKSTLVQHLNLLLVPTAGRVLVDGEDALSMSRPELRRRVGLVFQSPEQALFAPTVEEDVAFAPRRLGLGEEEVRERVRETLDLLGAGHLAARPPFALSAARSGGSPSPGCSPWVPRCWCSTSPRRASTPTRARSSSTWSDA